MDIQWGQWSSGRLFFGIIIVGLFFMCSASQASSFPFRTVSPGDPIPSLTFTAVADGKTVTTDSLKGNPAAYIFWGADIETKKDRSLKAFNDTEKILPFLEERKVKVLLVNAQGDPKDVMESVVSGLSGKMPVYTDDSQKAYGDLGIFIVPSVMLVDKDGKIVAGLGYSHDFSDRLKGEVQVMLGEKSRADMEKDLRPEMVEKSKEEKQTTRHLNTAMVMMKRGQTDSAISELKKALEIDPQMAEAQGQLGCLYLDKGQLDEAKKALDASYEIDPDYLPANICDARVRAEEGSPDEAVEDLKALLFRNARNPDLHYTLGTIYEKQEKFTEAAAEYRKAFELINKQVEFE
ncbi:MAG: tetratricopeptide repeat protein [Desulfobulbaceae bacterium]|nr:tetratricopeptide repeat protein [Desulfobulbaceae bacterium]